jgi:uncharacterized damage-inducible protein DinB
MKKLALFILFICLTNSAFYAQNDAISAFLLKWENSKTYLLEVAEYMPENNYDFKPTERQMSFKEQLVHIKNNMMWLSETYFSNENLTAAEKINSSTKTELLKELSNAFDNVAEIIKTTSLEELTTKVDFFAGAKSKLQILNLLQDHVTHHRGQLIVYLNLNNIAPPKYSGW